MHVTDMLLEYAPHQVTGPGAWVLQALLCTVLALLVLRGHVPDRVRYER